MWETSRRSFAVKHSDSHKGHSVIILEFVSRWRCSGRGRVGLGVQALVGVLKG